MKKRFFVIALSLLLVLTLIPALSSRANAAIFYDLWVGGVQVSGLNRDDIFSDGGSAKYDPSTHTLTLNDPTFPGYYTDSEGDTARIYSLLSAPLTIKGKATFSGDACTWNVYCGKTDDGYMGELILDGDFTISYGSSTAFSLLSYGDLSVTGGTINSSTRACGLLRSYRGNVYLTGGSVTATTQQNPVVESSQHSIIIGNDFRLLDVRTVYSSSALYAATGFSIGSQLEITTPENAVVGTEWILESDGTTLAKHVVIARAFDLWVGGVRVTGQNMNDILSDGGKAKYNPNTQVLTLNNPQLTGSYPAEGSNAVIYSKMADVIIKGSAAIDATGHTWAVYVGETSSGYNGELILNGDFSFTGASAYDALSYGDLVIKDGSLTCGSLRSFRDNVRIVGGSVTATKGVQAEEDIILGNSVKIVDVMNPDSIALYVRYGDIYLDSDLVIVTPESATLKDRNIYGADDEIADHVVIASPDGLKPAITTQPTGKTTTVGKSVKFTVAAAGPDLTYQWQYKKAGSSTWYNSTSSGNKTATLTVEATEARNGMQFRCKVTNPYGDAKSSAATLKIKPAITTQPANKTAAVGTNAKFTVAASGPDLTYQWQYKKSGSSTWYSSTSTGNKTATLTVEATEARNGMQFRCKVTNANGSATSNAATLTVTTASKPTITTQPTGKTVAAGANAKFTVAASGSGLSYQWQYKKAGSSTWYNSTSSGNKTATLTVEATAAREGMQFRCKVTNSAGTATSSAATLKVKPAITTQPANKTASVGTSVKFKVEAAGPDLTYQWQYKKSGSSTWYNSTSTGNKTATLTVEATTARNGMQFRCVVTNANGSATSNAAKLTVN